jgi:nucleotide-binding universal stress UspA family protein
MPFGPEGPGSFGLEAMDRDHARAELPRFLGTDRHRDVTIHYDVSEASPVHKHILTHAEYVGADLLVLGTHGRSGFDRLFFGSVAEKVLRTSHLPVMTVPPRVHDDVRGPGDPFKRILYATDFSAGSSAALHYAASLARHAAAQLIAMHVVEPIPVWESATAGGSFDISRYRASLEAEATRRLHDEVPEWIRGGCDTVDVVVTGKPYVELLRVAADRQVDLIVVSIHGRMALDRLVFGSTTEQIVRRAECPVLTVRSTHPQA